MANDETMPKQREGRDLVETWLLSLPLEAKLAACLLWTMTDGDQGDRGVLANEIFDKYEQELIEAAQDEHAPVSLETRTVLGAWLARTMLDG